jgi:hypothetical protein
LLARGADAEDCGDGELDGASVMPRLFLVSISA